MKTTLTVDIEYDRAKTGPEGLACAMDRLLETALSSPDLLDEYGNPTIGEFLVAKEETTPASVPLVLIVSGGVLQDVYGPEFGVPAYVVDWDTEGCDPEDANIVEIPLDCGGTRRLAVLEHPVGPLEQLAGSETEAALKAAGVDLMLSSGVSRRRWVIYDPDSDSLLTTDTYDSYAEAADAASEVDDALVLTLSHSEIHV